MSTTRQGTTRGWRPLCAGALILLAGCSGPGGGDAAPASDWPSGIHEATRVETLSLQEVVMLLEVEVTNPWDELLHITFATYTLSADGEPFFRGGSEVNGLVGSGESVRVPVPVNVRFGDLLRPVDPGSVLRWQGVLELSAGSNTIEVQAAGEMPVPTFVDVSVEHITWLRIEPHEAEGLMQVRLRNPNSFPVHLIGADYVLSLAGVSISQMRSGPGREMGPDEELSAEVPFRFVPADLGPNVLKLLTGDGANYELSGTVEGHTAWGDMWLSYVDSGWVAFTRRATDG